MFDFLSTKDRITDGHFANNIAYSDENQLIFTNKVFLYKNSRKINLVTENYFIALRSGQLENLLTGKVHNLFCLPISMEFYAENLFVTDIFNRLYIFNADFSIKNIKFEISAVFKIKNEIFYLSTENYILNRKLEKKIFVDLPSRIFKVKVFNSTILFFHKQGCTIYEDFIFTENEENAVDIAYIGGERIVIYKEDREDDLFDFLYRK